MPATRMPGFMFHQAERRMRFGFPPCDNAFNVPWPCYPWNARDFDLLGYRYSVLSNIATAGLNAVLTFIPARDDEESILVPSEDVAFVQRWLRWADAHTHLLRRA